MSRMTVLWFVVAVVGCEGGKSTPTAGEVTGGDKTGDSTRSSMTKAIDKVKGIGNKVGGALDKLDVDEAKDKLAAAKASVANGLEAAEECSWAARVADDALNEAAVDPVKELRRICSFEAPMGRATRALGKAEAAKAEQPQAPSLTECSSDDWSSAKQKLDSSPHASEPRWVELKARWAKVCP